MIFEFIFALPFNMIKYLVDFLSITPIALPAWSTHAITIILKGLAFFPFDIWSVLFTNFLFWIVVHFMWVVVEWIYKKIPGVS